MPIIRTIHNRANPYCIINKSFLDNPELSAKAKGILAYLLSRPDNWETNIKQLVKVMADGKDAIASGLKELEKKGYLLRHPVRDEKGRITHWVKDVYEKPMENSPVKNADFPITGKSASGGLSTSGLSINGKSGSGKTVSGKTGSIIYKDEVTNEKINNEEISNECNNAHVREDTHTQAESDPVKVKVSDQEAELVCEVMEGELESPGIREQQQDQNNSHSQKNSVNPKDQDSAAPCDNTTNATNEEVKYNGFTVEQVERLQERFDSGEVTDLPRREKIALALYTMPEVSVYRKSGKILGSKPNDIDPAFLRFFAYTQWNGSTDLDKARCTILNYESSLERWNVLYSVIQRWIKSRNDPEQGYKDLAAEAMTRLADKRQPMTAADAAMLNNHIKIKHHPQSEEAKARAVQMRQDKLDQLRRMEEENSSKTTPSKEPEPETSPTPMPETVKQQIEKMRKMREEVRRSRTTWVKE